MKLFMLLTIFFISITYSISYPSTDNNIEFIKHLPNTFAISLHYNQIYNKIFYEGTITLINNSTFMLDDLSLVEEGDELSMVFSYVNENTGEEGSKMRKLSKTQKEVFETFFTFAYYKEVLRIFYYKGKSLICSYKDESSIVTFKHTSEKEDAATQEYKLLKIAAASEEDYEKFKQIFKADKFCFKEYPEIDDVADIQGNNTEDL